MSETTGPRGEGCICGGKGPTLSAMLRMAMQSEAAGQHFRKAALELMLGFREILDQRIRTMSETPVKGTKLNVE
jgi:hypothetical protein